jgi:predicted nuclease of predicted toxin-antitoxin system
VKVLFDQNLPHKLRIALAGPGSRHEIVTTAYLGWGELQNGELLRTAEANGMEVLVTGDGSLSFEQNLTGRQLAIVALSTNNWPIIKNHVPRILAAIDGARPGSFQTVDCGRFTRPSPAPPKNG